MSFGHRFLVTPDVLDDDRFAGAIVEHGRLVGAPRRTTSTSQTLHRDSIIANSFSECHLLLEPVNESVNGF